MDNFWFILFLIMVLMFPKFMLGVLAALGSVAYLALY